ncbi:putative methyltransferase [Cronobacter malonaticus 681]|nr:putative methyltransferase [Cronobacter malonaticus 681]
MLRDNRNVIALAPDLELLHRGGAEGIACCQHHRFALLFELTRQFTDGGGFTHAVDADHQDNKRRFAFDIQRLVHFRQDLAHLFFQQAIERLGIAQLLAARAFGEVGDDFTRGVHTHIGNQQLLFELLEQIVVDFFAAKQTDKSGTEIFFGFQQTAFKACEETLFGGFFLLRDRRGFFLFRLGFQRRFRVSRQRNQLFFANRRVLSGLVFIVRRFHRRLNGCFFNHRLFNSRCFFNNVFFDDCVRGRFWLWLSDKFRRKRYRRAVFFLLRQPLFSLCSRWFYGFRLGFWLNRRLNGFRLRGLFFFMHHAFADGHHVIGEFFRLG